MPARSILMASSLAGFLALGAAHAQTAPAQTPRATPDTRRQPAAQQQAAPAAPINAGVAVSERFTFAGLGLSIALPEDATAVEEAVGGNFVGRVRDIKNTWQVTIERRKSSNTNLKLKEVADTSLRQLFERFGISIEKDGALWTQPDWKLNPDRQQVNGKMVSVATLLLREPAQGKQLTIRNAGKQLAAERFYIFMPAMDQSKAGVRGVTFVELAPGEFLTFDMVTNAAVPADKAASDPLPDKIDVDVVNTARAPYEMIVASSELVDDTANETQRSASVQASKRIIEALTSEQLQEIVKENPERWERIYRPSADGAVVNDQEVGYRRIRLTYGPRRNMPGINVKGVEGATPGFLVRIDARVLDGERVIDSQSSFFMTPDRNEESWRVSMTIRTGEQAVTHNEIGARVGSDMKVTITSDDGTNERTVRPQVAPEGYISRVESYLLPAVLVRSGIPTIYGTYAYQSQSERVQYRRDVLEQPRSESSGANAGKPKPFTLRTRMSDDQVADQVSLYDAKGVLIRSELSTGVLSEPSSHAEIKKLWESKGLPTK